MARCDELRRKTGADRIGEHTRLSVLFAKGHPRAAPALAAAGTCFPAPAAFPAAAAALGPAVDSLWAHKERELAAARQRQGKVEEWLVRARDAPAGAADDCRAQLAAEDLINERAWVGLHWRSNLLVSKALRLRPRRRTVLDSLGALRGGGLALDAAHLLGPNALEQLAQHLV